MLGDGAIVSVYKLQDDGSLSPADADRFDAEVERLRRQGEAMGAIDLGGGARWYLRCRGRAGTSPCLLRRGHKGECAPSWGAT